MADDRTERSPDSLTALMSGASSDGQPKHFNKMHDADRALASQLGYKAVFKREFGYLSTVSFAISIGALFPSVATTFIYSLQAGGSAAIVWCWLISGFGCMCLALSVAELVSAYPTSGGLYYTVPRLAPKEYVPYLSWTTGWLNLLGQAAGVSASEWGAASLPLATISMASDFMYLPSIHDTVATMAGMMILSGLVNSLPTYWLAKLTSVYGILHVLVLISCIVALLVKARPENGTPKHSAKYIFTNFESQSGWQPAEVSFLFGFFSVSWTMSGYDATAHIAEEVNNPEVKTPWAISPGMLFTYIAGWLYNIVLRFVMDDISGPDSILNSPIEQPVAQIFYSVLGKYASVFYTICALIIVKFGNFAAMQSLTRTTFALSRDGLVHFAGIWTTISPLTGTPILAVCIAVVFCTAINLVGLASYPAVAGVFNLMAIALDWSFCIPLFCKIWFGQFTPGPWHLGKLSRPVNIYALAADTMNYAVFYLVAILLFSSLYWVLRGKKYYTGPRMAVGIDKSVPGQSRTRSKASSGFRRENPEREESQPLLGDEL